MPRNDNTVALMQSILTTVKKIGIDRTTEALNKAAGNHATTEDKRVDLILSMVSTGMEISVTKIIDRTRGSHRKLQALHLSIYFLKKAGYSLEQISNVLGRNKGQMCRYHQAIKADANQVDSAYYKHIKKFEKEFEKIKNIPS